MDEFVQIAVNERRNMNIVITTFDLDAESFERDFECWYQESYSAKSKTEALDVIYGMLSRGFPLPWVKY